MKIHDPMISSISGISHHRGANKEKKNDILRDKCAYALYEILHPKFEHPYAIVTPTTFRPLYIQELTELHAFIVDGILRQQSSGSRFQRLITESLNQSICRYPYKLGMVEYIATFGHKFHRHPCSYTPAVLESVANYCEHLKLHGSNGA